MSRITESIYGTYSGAYNNSSNPYASLFRDQLPCPVEFHWAGWRSTPHDLVRHGWNLSANQDYYARRLVLAMQHKQRHVEGRGYISNYDFSSVSSHPIPMEIDLANHCNLILPLGLPLEGFMAAEPRLFPMTSPGCISDLLPFIPLAGGSTDIILPEPGVDELLAKILALQEPGRNEYYRDQIRQSKAQPGQVHSRIITLAA